MVRRGRELPTGTFTPGVSLTLQFRGAHLDATIVLKATTGKDSLLDWLLASVVLVVVAGEEAFPVSPSIIPVEVATTSGWTFSDLFLGAHRLVATSPNPEEPLLSSSENPRFI